MVIERKFIKDKIREYGVKEYLENYLKRVGFSHIDIQKTPVGFSIIIYSSKPGLIVGRHGINIKEIQDKLQKDFGLESPVVEVREVENPDLDPQITAERIGNQLLKFGVARFKAIGHKVIDQIMKAGAIGAEIKISGLVPSERANFWKFNAGYLPKCGEVAITKVEKGFKTILIKRGIIGITVKILPPNIQMPDQVYLKDKTAIQVEENNPKVEEISSKEEIKEEKKEEKKKAPRKKRAVKTKKEESDKESKVNNQESKENTQEKVI